MSDEAKLRERAHGELGYDCTEHAEGAHNARCDELTSLLRDAAVEATEAALAGMPCSVPDCKNVSWTPGRCRTHLVPALTAEARRDALGEAIEAAERRRQYWRRFLDQGGPDTFKERWDTRESEALCIRDGLRALAAQQPPPSPRADVGAMSPEGREEQRRSFAYGNCNIENPRVTREVVDRAAEELAKDGQATSPPVQPDEPPVYNAEEDARLDGLEAAKPDVAAGEAPKVNYDERYAALLDYAAFLRSKGREEEAKRLDVFAAFRWCDPATMRLSAADRKRAEEVADRLAAPPSPPGEPPGEAVAAETPAEKP